MRFEMELRFVSERLVGKEMFFGCSDEFDWDFNPEQRRNTSELRNPKGFPKFWAKTRTKTPPKTEKSQNFEFAK